MNIAIEKPETFCILTMLPLPLAIVPVFGSFLKKVCSVPHSPAFLQKFFFKFLLHNP